MSIQTAIYSQLAADTELAALLAASTINAAQPAIYEQWAPPETPMPYINLTYSSTEGNHWAKRDARLYVDIFSSQDSTQAEAIRNRVIKILDRQKITLENGTQARIHSDSDGLAADTQDAVTLTTHWEIQFTVFYWRQTWAQETE